MNHRIRINRHRVIGTTGGDRGGGIAGGDTDAVVARITSADIQAAVEARASEIADQVGDDLFCGTEQSQQRVLRQAGGVCGESVTAAGAADGGGTCSGGDRGGAVTGDVGVGKADRAAGSGRICIGL